MIAPLRTRHRVVITALAVIVPVLFLLGLGARRPMPRNDVLPIAASPSPPAGAEVLTLGDVPVDARTWSTTDGSWVQVAWRAAPTAPDVLVYWTAERPSDDVLPAGATLLGALGGGRALPLTEAGGALVLYSLAHRTVVGWVALSAGGAS